MILMESGGGIFLSAAYTEQMVAEDRAKRFSLNQISAHSLVASPSP